MIGEGSPTVDTFGTSEPRWFRIGLNATYGQAPREIRVRADTLIVDRSDQGWAGALHVLRSGEEVAVFAAGQWSFIAEEADD